MILTNGQHCFSCIYRVRQKTGLFMSEDNFATTNARNACDNVKSSRILSFLLLSRRSRQPERLSASMLSICSSVCLSVAKMQKKTRFSQKLSNLELLCLLTTYRKSYMGFSKNTSRDPKKSKLAEIRHLGS